MTSTRARTIGFTAAAAVVLATGLGCGVLSAANDAVHNISAISDLADKINNSGAATYQADYRLEDGSTVTVAQQPPNSADIGTKTRYLATADAFFLCEQDNGKWTCEKTPSTGSADPQSAAMAAGLTGNGFISAPMAVAVLTAAAIVPHAKVDMSTQNIAGQRSTCATVSNLEQAQRDPTQTPKVSDFTVCVTDQGILARFSGTATDGKKAKVELTKYSPAVDPNLFRPPAGATIKDTTELTQPPAPTNS
jgi:hypothetical protein